MLGTLPRSASFKHLIFVVNNSIRKSMLISLKSRPFTLSNTEQLLISIFLLLFVQVVKLDKPVSGYFGRLKLGRVPEEVKSHAEWQSKFFFCAFSYILKKAK